MRFNGKSSKRFGPISPAGSYWATGLGGERVSAKLFVLLGLILLIVGLWGLVAGKVIAGSRGLHPNFYSRKGSPFLYYSFKVLYLAIGSLVLIRAL